MYERENEEALLGLLANPRASLHSFACPVGFQAQVAAQLIDIQKGKTELEDALGQRFDDMDQGMSWALV